MIKSIMIQFRALKGHSLLAVLHGRTDELELKLLSINISKGKDKSK